MSTATRLPVSRLAERVAIALGTAHDWGYVEYLPPRWGAPPIRRITVFSPDITRPERRAVALARHWPVGGAILTLFAIVGLGMVLPPVTAALIAFGLFAASIVVIQRGTRRARRLSVQLDDLSDDQPPVVDVERRLEQLEAAARDGLIGDDRHRSEWASLFRRLQSRV